MLFRSSAILVKDFLGHRRKEPGEVYGCQSQPPSPRVGLSCAILVKDFLGHRRKEPGEVYGCQSQPPSPLVGLGDRPVLFLIRYSHLARLAKLQSRHDNGAKRRGELGLARGVLEDLENL